MLIIHSQSSQIIHSETTALFTESAKILMDLVLKICISVVK